MLFAAAGRGGGAAGAAAGNPQVVDLTDPAVEPIGAPPIRKSQHATIMNFIVLAGLQNHSFTKFPQKSKNYDEIQFMSMPCYLW